MHACASLLRMRIAALKNSLFNLRRDSMAKAFVVVFGLGNVLALGYWVSYNSFEFIDGFKAFGDLNAKMVALLFLALLILVILSTLIITYTTVFVARETAFLFQNPIPHRAILFLKLAEAIGISSWASLFLCLPVLVAYGVLRDAGALYYIEMAAVLCVFLFFAGLVGASLSLLLAPLFRRLSPRALLASALLALVGLTWVFLRSFQFAEVEGENHLLLIDRFANGMRAMHSPFSPSRWASAAVLAACDSHHREVLVQGATLLANTLIFLPLLSLYGRRFYQREWVARQGSLEGRREGRRSRRLLSASRWPVVSLLGKDVLLFFRSPSQLSQLLLFLLLMVIYSLSLLQVPDFFKDSERNAPLHRFIFFSNLAAVCMILSSFTSRFLFPLLSLEGKAFWILGLAPMRRRDLLLQKLVFGLVMSLALGLLTIAISNLALRSPPDLFASAVYTMVLASVSLTSLATGLGAAYPSFDEDNPARIAVGLGGTLNFFASALTIACLIALQAAPYLILGAAPGAAPLRPWIIAAAHLLAFGFAAAVSTFVLRLGGRHLERSEF